MFRRFAGATIMTTVMLLFTTTLVWGKDIDELRIESFEPSAASAQIHVPADYATIQSAVDNASPGDTIHVVGDYRELVRVETPSITIRANDDATLTGTFVVLADGVSIENWHIITDFSNQGLQTFNVSHVSVKNSTFVPGSPGTYLRIRGIWLDACQDCSIKNNVFEGHLYDGMGVYGDCSGTEIKNNVSINNGDTGFRLFGGSTGTHLANNLARDDDNSCMVITDWSGGGHTFRNNHEDCP